MQGYYKCEKCNIAIEVVTNDTTKRFSKAKISKCPHCMDKIVEIEYEDFSRFKFKLFLRLSRIYGNKKIMMKVKFT